ncbi:MAG: mannose-6-phosphate isomerase, class I [Candidatus Nanopelagicales bacterium]
MYVVDGALKEYAWGRHDGLARWTGRHTAGPQAELWFGAHPSGPSWLRGRPGHLADALSGDGGQFPLLVKLLAAARPLSIQVHPEESLARRMFEARGSAGAPLLADPDEKTEMLVALERFSVLVGFRDPEEAVPLLRALGRPAAAAAEAYAAGDVAGAVAALLRTTDRDRDEALGALASAVARLSEGDAAAMDVVEAAFPGDRGILVALCMRHHELHPGDAVYVPAGTVHAYVHGLAVEVMTSSDNVLRLGLTPKVVAVDEALAAFDPAAVPQLLRVDADEPVHAYRWPGAPFHVTRVRGASTVGDPGRARLVLGVDGRTVVTTGGATHDLAPGSALVALADEPGITVQALGTAFVAEEGDR